MEGQYNTYGATLTPYGLTCYCYNDKITNIVEFVRMEDMAFQRAMQRQYKLFDVYEPVVTDYPNWIKVSRN